MEYNFKVNKVIRASIKKDPAPQELFHFGQKIMPLDIRNIGLLNPLNVIKIA